MYNRECKVRPEIININSNESLSYSYSVKISKCSGNCNNINDPYAKLDKGRCDTGFICNPSNYECECDNRLCDTGQYLDYKNCKCGKKLVDKLVEECSENINENEMIHNDSGNV